MRTPLEVDIIIKVIQVKKDTETKIKNKLKEYQNMPLIVDEKTSKEITKDTCKKLGI